VRLVGFIKRVYHDARSPERLTSASSLKSNALSFPWGHPVAAYIFFLVFLLFYFFTLNNVRVV